MQMGPMGPDWATELLGMELQSVRSGVFKTSDGCFKVCRAAASSCIILLWKLRVQNNLGTAIRQGTAPPAMESAWQQACLEMRSA